MKLRRCILIVLIMGLGLFVCCNEETKTMSIVLEGDTKTVQKLENLLEQNPGLLNHQSETEYSITIVKPDPNIDYKIAKVTSDSDVEYKIDIIDPQSNKEDKILSRQFNKAILDFLQKTSQQK